MIVTKFKIDLSTPLEEVEQFFEIEGETLKTALQQDRTRWQHRGVVNSRLQDYFADFDWDAKYDPENRPGLQHYSPSLRLEKFEGGATPWPLACFAFQHKDVMLGLTHNPKIVIGPGALFFRGYENINETAWMLFEGDEFKARSYFDRKWGSYRRYITCSGVEKHDPPFVQLKSDGSRGMITLCNEPLYPRILTIDK